MENLENLENLNSEAQQLAKKQTRRSLWRRVVMVPAALVVFFTVYVLIMPAFTQTRQTYCGQEEHVHTEECYAENLICGLEDGQELTETVSRTYLNCTEELHKHTRDCYNSDKELICGYADFVVHTHDSSCYDGSGAFVCRLDKIEEHEHTSKCFALVEKLICGQEEAEAHSHTDACYTETTETELVCGQQEAEAHSHTDACYTVTAETELSCGREEAAPHSHTDACYTVTAETALSCGQEEREGHSHSGACYENVYNENGELVESVLVCGKEENAGHSHSSDCYTTTERRELSCGKEETEGHSHSADCYTTTERRELSCGKEESAGHSHSDDCYVTIERRELSCGKEETEGHSHSSDCYEIEEDTVCGKEEIILHTHTDKCFDEYDRLICGKLEVREHSHADCWVTETETLETVHEHTAACFETVLACGLEAHEHTEDCYIDPEEAPGAAGESGLVEGPGIVEAPGTAEEPALTCGREEHTHDASCIDEEENVICGLEEHSHTDDCYEQAAAVAPLPPVLPEDGIRIELPSADGEEGAGGSADIQPLAADLPKTKNGKNDLATFVDFVFGKGTTQTGPDTFVTDLNIQFTIDYDSFDIDGNKNLEFEYVLPEGVTLTEEMLAQSGTVKDRGMEAFSYHFVENEDGTYSIIIEFNEDYVRQDKLSKSGFIEFECGLELEEGEDQRDFDFGGTSGTDLTITRDKHYDEEERPGETPDPSEKPTHDLGISKEIVWGVGEDEGRIYYRIKVKSQYGTLDDVTLTDTIFGSGGATVGSARIESVVRHKYNPAGWYNSEDDYTLSESEYLFSEKANGGFEMLLPQLVKEADGSYYEYEILYSYPVESLPSDDTQFTNIANASSGTDRDQDTQSRWVHKKDEVQKSGSRVGQKDSSGEYIKDEDGRYVYKDVWTINVNNSDIRTDLTGYELRDDALRGLRPEDLNINPDKGWEPIYDGDELVGIRFTDIDGKGNYNHYVITYETEVADPEVGGSNHAHLGDGHDGTIGEGVGSTNPAKPDEPPPPDPNENKPDTSKELDTSRGDNGADDIEGTNQKRVHWKSTINASEEKPILAGQVYYDQLDNDKNGGYYSNYQWIPFSEIKEMVARLKAAYGFELGVDYELDVYGGEGMGQYNGNTFTLDSEEAMTSLGVKDDGHCRGFAIRFLTDYDAPVELTYDSIVDASNEVKYKNTFDNHDGYYDTRSDHLFKTDGAYHTDDTIIEYDHVNELVWKVTINLASGKESMKVTDHLPAGVELLEVSYTAKNNNNWTYRADESDIADGTFQTYHDNYVESNFGASGTYTVNPDRAAAVPEGGKTWPAYDVTLEFPVDELTEDQQIEITYRCKITDDLWKEIEHWESSIVGEYQEWFFMNDVYVEVNDKELPPDSQTQIVVKKSEDKYISKAVNYDEPNVQYQVDIDTVEVVPGLDYLDLEDVLRYVDFADPEPEGWYDPPDHVNNYGWKQIYTILTETVGLYEAKLDDDGYPIYEQNPITGEWQMVPDLNKPIPFEFTIDEDLPVDTGTRAGYEWTKYIHAKIPNNGMAMCFLYTYHVDLEDYRNGDPGPSKVTIQVSNVANLEGHTSQSGNNRDSFDWGSVTAGITEFGVSLYKRDANNMAKAVPGAEFTILEKNGEGAFVELADMANTFATGSSGQLHFKVDKTFKVVDGVVSLDLENPLEITVANNTESWKITLQPNTVYRWQETAAPEGYESDGISDNYIYFWFTDDPDFDPGVDENGDAIRGHNLVTEKSISTAFYNVRESRAKLTIYKEDAGSGERLPGAGFTLYEINETGEKVRREFFTDRNGEITLKIVSVDQVTGKMEVIIESQSGSSSLTLDVNALYYWLETTPPFGYEKTDTEKHYFWYDEDGSGTGPNIPADARDVIRLVDQAEAGVTVTDEELPGMELEKVSASSEGVKLSGAEFMLYEADEDGNPTGVSYGPYVTDRTGKIRLAVTGYEGETFTAAIQDANGVDTLTLDSGKRYYWQETKAPDGYDLTTPAEKLFFRYDEIKDNDGLQTTQVTNKEHVYPGLTIRKVDTQGNLIEGATFAIFSYQGQQQGYYLPGSGDRLDSFTTGADGKIKLEVNSVSADGTISFTITANGEKYSFTALSGGDKLKTDTLYYWEEISAPDGYVKTAKRHYFYYSPTGDKTVEELLGSNTQYYHADMENAQNLFDWNGTFEAVNYTREEVPPGLQISKIDATDPDNPTALPGVTFTLKAIKGAIRDENGNQVAGITAVTDESGLINMKVLSVDKVNGEATVEIDGQVYILETDRIYYWEETAVPEGYVLPTPAMRCYFWFKNWLENGPGFDPEYSGYEDAMWNDLLGRDLGEEQVTAIIENQRELVYELLKVDGETNEPLAGATFALYSKDGPYYNGNGPLTVTTGTDGKILLKVKSLENSDSQMVVDIYVTGEDGSEQLVAENVWLNTDALYYWQETAAPKGYDRPDPNPKYGFWYSHEKTEDQLEGRSTLGDADTLDDLRTAADGRTSHTAVNMPKPELPAGAGFNIYKYDAEDPSQMLPGAQFQIKYEDPNNPYYSPVFGTNMNNENGQYQFNTSYWETDENGQISIKVKRVEGGKVFLEITDARGTYVCAEGLNVNQLYWWEESAAPAGYEKTSEDKCYFYYSTDEDFISQHPDGYNLHDLELDPETSFPFSVSNKKIPTVEIEKVDSITGKALAGARFAIYKLEDGSLVLEEYWDGSKNVYLETDANGILSMYPEYSSGSWNFNLIVVSNGVMLKKDNLEVNKLYYLQETNAPEGYVTPDPAPKYYFWYSKDGCPLEQATGYDKLEPGAVIVDLSDPTAFNVDPIPNDFDGDSYFYDILKVDGEGQVLAGAEFTLYEIVDGTPLEPGYGPYTTGEDGRIQLIVQKDKNGNYTTTVKDAKGIHDIDPSLTPGHLYGWKETKAPSEEYTLTDTIYYVALGSDQTAPGEGAVWDLTGTQTEPETVVNTKDTPLYPYELYKVDKDGEPLAGATFTLYEYLPGGNADGSDKRTEKATVTTDDTGKITVTPEKRSDGDYNITINPGNTVLGPLSADTLYYWQETASPRGYVKDTAPRYFWFRENGDASSEPALSAADLCSEPGAGSYQATVTNFPSSYRYEILKTDGDQKPLAGAEFTLFACDENGGIPLDENGEPDLSQAIAGPYTSSANGLITVEATALSDGRLEVTIKHDGRPEVIYLDADTLYCWRETKVPDPNPDPYVGSDELYYFWFSEEAASLEELGAVLPDGATVQMVVGDGSAAKTTQNVVNPVDNSGFELPESGGAGTIPYTLAGLLTVFSAGAVYILTQRKRRGVGTDR